MKRKRISIKVDKIKKALIESLKQGAFITTACDKVGISRDSFYDWYHKDKKFRDEVDKALTSRIKIVEDVLFKKALEGNVTAIIFFLCNRDPERWKNVQRVETLTKLEPIKIEIKQTKDEKEEEKRE